jgi:hypothetical protein
MRNASDRTTSSSNSQSISAEGPLTLERALDLLGKDSLPFAGDIGVGFVLSGLSKMVSQYGEAWVRRHRKRLWLEIEFLDQTYGIGDMQSSPKLQEMLRKALGIPDPRRTP